MEIATPFTVFVLLSSFLSSLHGKLTTCSSFYFFSRRRFPQVKRRGCLHCPFTDQRTEKLRNPFIFLEGGGRLLPEYLPEELCNPSGQRSSRALLQDEKNLRKLLHRRSLGPKFIIATHLFFNEFLTVGCTWGNHRCSPSTPFALLINLGSGGTVT